MDRDYIFLILKKMGGRDNLLMDWTPSRRKSALDVDWDFVGFFNLCIRSMYSHLKFVPVKFFCP